MFRNKKIWEEKKLPKTGVILSIGGNHIRTKLLTVPKTSVKRQTEILEREFRESNFSGEESVCGSMKIGVRGKDELLFGITAEKSFLKSLSDLFDQMGIRLSKITSQRCGVIRELSYLDAIKGKNCILQLMDGDVLTTVLVECESYVNLSSVRLFVDRGSPEFGAEVTRNISQIMQFQSSMRSENRVTDVYCIGFEDGDYKASCDQVAALSLRMNRLEKSGGLSVAGGSIAACFGHTGVFALQAQDANLYREWKSREDTRRKDKYLLKILPVLAVVAILAAVTSFLAVKNQNLQKTADELSAYVSDQENLQKLEDYNTYIAGAAEFNAKYHAAESIREALLSYPLATSALNRIIAECGDGIVSVTVDGYSAGTGELSFTAIGTNAETLNEFVKALTNTGIFYHVTYPGYVLLYTGDTYKVNVSCTLDGSAGR